MENEKQHGGRRTGAGRPTAYGKRAVRLSVTVDPDVVVALDNYRAAMMEDPYSGGEKRSRSYYVNDALYDYLIRREAQFPS